jgi:hypothetical protein
VVDDNANDMTVFEQKTAFDERSPMERRRRGSDYTQPSQLLRGRSWAADRATEPKIDEISRYSGADRTKVARESASA